MISTNIKTGVMTNVGLIEVNKIQSASCAPAKFPVIRYCPSSELIIHTLRYSFITNPLLIHKYDCIFRESFHIRSEIRIKTSQPEKCHSESLPRVFFLLSGTDFTSKIRELVDTNNDNVETSKTVASERNYTVLPEVTVS